MDERLDREPPLRDLRPSLEEMREDVLQGLKAPRKRIPPKYLYDERGSRLFQQITALKEYYLTRTERRILERFGAEMAAAIGAKALLIEPGSGAGEKVRVVLDRLDEPVAYVPVEISRAQLLEAAQAIRAAYPGIEVLPVCADFTQPFSIPAPSRPARRTVVFFPGSTIGNFAPAAAVQLLSRFRRLAGGGGGLLIGVDLRKDRRRLERAYNDEEGVTAAFNRNLLRRLNRELGADFDLDAFAHRAVWNEAESRVEMHLVSLKDQRVQIGGTMIPFAKGETIHTESSYKHTPQSFAALAAEAGLALKRVWMDDEKLFSVLYLEAA